MVDRNSLVFNTVCQMFQLFCILLQAIACCTKRNLKQLFPVLGGCFTVAVVVVVEWQWLAREESEWKVKDIFFFNCAPPTMACFCMFLWAGGCLVQCGTYDQNDEALIWVIRRLKRVTKENSLDLCESKNKRQCQYLIRDCLISLTSQPVYSLLSQLRKSF